jgi:hypothetical protein
VQIHNAHDIAAPRFKRERFHLAGGIAVGFERQRSLGEALPGWTTQKGGLAGFLLLAI